MAKRYAEFNRVPEGFFKPEGTLGRHHCTVVRQGDEKVVVGSVAGRVTLKPGDTLGYDCGTIWLVPRVESYQDPIRRVLAQAHLGQKLLEFSTKPVEFTDSWQDTSGWPENSAADPSTGEEAAFLGDGLKSVVEDTGGNYIRRQITGGDAIVVRRAMGNETTSRRPRRVVRIVVRPASNKAAVAKWLAEEALSSLLPGHEDRQARKEELVYQRLLKELGPEIRSKIQRFGGRPFEFWCSHLGYQVSVLVSQGKEGAEIQAAQPVKWYERRTLLRSVVDHLLIQRPLELW